MTASRLEIAAGLLPAGDVAYQIGLLAAKDNRSDSDVAVVRVLSGAAPTGTIRQVAGCFQAPGKVLGSGHHT